MNQQLDINRQSMTMENARQLESAIKKLPSFSRVITEAQQALSGAEMDLDKIAGILENDPQLVITILKIANSSYYGLSRKVANIRDACIVLGQMTLKNIVITAALKNIINPKLLKDPNYISALKHFIHTAILSRDLAKMAGINSDMAYIVGLLHDISIIFFDTLCPACSNLSLQDIIETENDDHAADDNEPDHAYLSAMIAREWKLPDDIVLSLQYHDHVEQDASSVNLIIFVANKISSALLFPEQFGDSVASIDTALLERIGMNGQRLDEFMDSCVKPEAISISELFG